MDSEGANRWTAKAESFLLARNKSDAICVTSAPRSEPTRVGLISSPRAKVQPVLFMYRGTLLRRNRCPVGPYSRTMPRILQRP